MRSVRLALFSAALAACGAEGPEPRGTYQVVSGAAPLIPRSSTAGPTLIYLNRCGDGCFIEPGPDDARRNRSSIVPFPVTLRPSRWSNDVWSEVVRCTQRLYEPFEVVVTDQDPGNVPHFENIVAGEPGDLAMPPVVGGVAPLTCGGLENAVSFTFPLDRPTDVFAVCTTVGQETAHAFGLDHQMLCNDPMTYLPACGDEKAFQRIDAPCGEHGPRECICGQPYQNSYLALLAVLGPRRTPQRLAPRLRFADPEPDQRVEAGFLVHLEASDEAGIVEVTLKIDGQPSGTSSSAPYVFRTPVDLQPGLHLLEGRALDGEGLSTEIWIEVDLFPKRARPDAWLPPILPDAAAIVGPSPADAGVASAADGAEAGCSCRTERSGDGGGAIGLLALPLLALLARRRASLVATLLLLLGCDDGASITGAGGRLALEPEVTTLDFGTHVLGRPLPAPAEITARNEGTGALQLTRTAIEGSPAFALIGRARTLAPEQENLLLVAFEPTAAGEAEGELVIASDDPDRREVRYPLLGRAREACKLEMGPLEVRFRLEEVKEIEIRASGRSPCTVVRMAFDRRYFDWVEAPSLPFTLAPGEARTLSIRHTSRTTGRDVPRRELKAYDQDGTEAVIRLVGIPPVWDCWSAYPEEIIVPIDDRGVEHRLAARILNRCDDETLRIMSVGLNGGREWSVDPIPTPLYIPPLGDVTIQIRYTPEDAGGDLAELILRSDDGVRRFSVVTLFGRARVPRLVVPEKVDLGPALDRPAGPGDPSLCNTSGLVPIYNFGDGPQHVTSLELAPGSDPDLALLGVYSGGALLDPRIPFLIPASGAAFALVEVAPRRPSPATLAGSLLIHRAYGDPPLAVALAAEVVPDGVQLERFTAQIPPADVLWIADDTLSGGVLAGRLQEAARGWSEVEASRAASVQLAVTLADAGWPNSGWPRSCLGHPWFLSARDADPAQRAAALECAVWVDGNGRTLPAGLGGGVRFVERALVPPPVGRTNPTFGFLREDAHLALVIASDEEDLSPQGAPLLVDYLRSLKGNRLSIHSISGLAGSVCPTDLPWLQASERYPRAVALAGGSLHDVCAISWGGYGRAIAEQVLAVSERFTLAHAELGDLAVRLDGAVVPPDPLDGFTFDARRRELTLHGASRPRAGQSVEVEYLPTCRPTPPAPPDLRE